MTSWEKNRGIVAAMSTLREMFRQKELHNRDLAALLGVTERTVTRWMSGKGLELEVLQDLCELVGISVGELFELAGSAGNTEPAQLTREMEQKLVDEPTMFVVFATLRAHSAEEAKQLIGLSEPEWIKALIGLEKLGLIQLLPKNRVRLLVPRSFRWLKDGPARQAHHAWFKATFGELAFGDPEFRSRYDTVSLSNRSIAIIEEHFRGLSNEISQLSATDRQFTAEAERKWYGVLFAVRPLRVSPFSYWQSRAARQQIEHPASRKTTPDPD
jgi:transcriptional regulator with XRE-family HTH domain